MGLARAHQDEVALVGAGLVERLQRADGRVALVERDGMATTYAELAADVVELRDELGAERRLVALTVANARESVVAYLAALAGTHPVALLAAGDDDHLATFCATYDPDVVVRTGESSLDVEVRRPGSAHDLNPDLAVLLSTSGSTGSPKLVRLSGASVSANAAAIASYLGIGPSDRAITSLPLQYCYGLSVLNSHLLQGASLVLSHASVVDRCFWTAVLEHHVTSFAGVPHTFELLDRVGFDDLELPSLRTVTQAGGRLAPSRVRHLAELGRRRGWRFFVMYGQTEATARMAYLPPELAAEHPEAIGVPIPGGAFAVEPVAGATEGSGELVYRGPNVMLGYATGPADLARGRDVHELRTGDLARRRPDGLYEVVGRASRFIKPFGVRVDLDRAEAVLAGLGHQVLCTGDDRRLVVGVASADPDDVEAVAGAARQRFGLPAGAVAVVRFDDLPRRANGKPDHASVARAAGPAPELSRSPDPDPDGRRRPSAPDLERVFAGVAAPHELTDGATFVDLGGDSLSYVEASVRLEEELGHLPPAWHTTPIGELRRLVPERRRTPVVETGVALRAAAIVLIVAAHAGALTVRGGAHVLLAVAGWNFARFGLAERGTAAEGLRQRARSIGRVALPSMAYVAALLVLAEGYTLATVALVNNYLADGTWRYWYWFVEVLVQVLVVAALVLAVPRVRALERAAPFAFASTALAASLALRLIPYGDPANQIYRTHSVLWLFLLGWAAQRATTTGQRALVSVAALAATAGFFGSGWRDLVVVAGLLALVWVPQIPLPRPLNRLAGALAGASLVIYLTHWQLLPALAGHAEPVVVTVLTLAVGVATWTLGRRALIALARRDLIGRRPSAGEQHGAGVGGEGDGDRRPHRRVDEVVLARPHHLARRQG